jgi:hypothetical protein
MHRSARPTEKDTIQHLSMYMTYNYPHGLMFDMYITIGTGKQL